MTLSRRQILRMASGLAAATVASSLTTFRSLAESAGVPGFLTGHFRPVNAAVLIPQRSQWRTWSISARSFGAMFCRCGK